MYPFKVWNGSKFVEMSADFAKRLRTFNDKKSYTKGELVVQEVNGEFKLLRAIVDNTTAGPALPTEWSEVTVQNAQHAVNADKLGGTVAADYALITDVESAKTGAIDTAAADATTKVNAALTESKEYTDTVVADLVDGAPEALDTLKELASALGAHEDAYDALLETVGNKAEKAYVDAELDKKVDIETQTIIDDNQDAKIAALEKAIGNTGEEGSLKDAIDALKAQDVTLQGKIDAEVIRATEAENALGVEITANDDAIKAEVTRATAAETALGARIDTAEGNIATALADAKAYTDTEIEKVEEAAVTLEGKVTANKDAIDAINHAETGILAQAKTYTDTEAEKKADTVYVDGELSKKADITYVTEELAKKAELNGSPAQDFSAKDLTVAGNLIVQGTTTSIETVNLEVKDNQIVINSGETGAGVSNGHAGIRVERGTEKDYLFQFDEDKDMFVVGMEGDLEVVATQPHVKKAVEDEGARVEGLLNVAKTALEGVDTALSERIADLETSIGADGSIGSDVAQLKETVGDDTKGLVKDVIDLKAKDAAVDDEIAALKAEDVKIREDFAKANEELQKVVNTKAEAIPATQNFLSMGADGKLVDTGMRIIYTGNNTQPELDGLAPGTIWISFEQE